MRMLSEYLFLLLIVLSDFYPSYKKKKLSAEIFFINSIYVQKNFIGILFKYYPWENFLSETLFFLNCLLLVRFFLHQFYFTYFMRIISCFLNIYPMLSVEKANIFQHFFIYWIKKFLSQTILCWKNAIRINFFSNIVYKKLYRVIFLYKTFFSI